MSAKPMDQQPLVGEHFESDIHRFFKAGQRAAAALIMRRDGRDGESTGRPPVPGDGVGAESLPDGRVRVSVSADGRTIHHDMPLSVARSFAADVVLVAAAAEAREKVLAGEGTA